MKFFCSALSHETSKFSPIPTNLQSYRDAYLYLPPVNGRDDGMSDALDEFKWGKLLKARGHEAAFGPLGSAMPSLPTNARDYATIKDALVGSLKAAMPVDAVAMFLHGAQVAEGVDDVEGDLLKAVREIVGPDVPVGVSFDLHGNISDAMMENATILLGCLEYPHIDFGLRAEEIVDLLERTALGEINPVMVRQRVPMLGTYFTTRSPMREFIDEVKALEGKDGILGVSITHGFAWADIEHCGANVIVVVDGDRAKAEALCQSLADRYFAMRDVIRTPRINEHEALAEAMAHDGAPVIIADTSDNPGGGAAGDSTYLLRALIEARPKNTALGMIWDPIAVHFCKAAGEGASLPLRIGGKAGAASGSPVDVIAKVLKIREGVTQNAQGVDTPIGDAVLIEAHGIKIVLNSRRDQVWDTMPFEAFGVDPRACDIVVVKGHQHFYEFFGPFASKVIYATPPGTVNQDYRSVKFENIPSPMYPATEPPFTAFGREWRK